jgi:ribosome-binding protein aMBF1 (putative translation factor)
MAECIKCEISDEKALLFDAVSREGVIKICRKCNSEENLPLINQVKEEEGIERERNVYNRLSKYAGLDPKEHRKKFDSRGSVKEDPTELENKRLKNIVDENYNKKITENAIPGKKREDMIYNFHWVIMRERRRKKLTQSQLAKEIQEPEQAVKLIEQGYLPEKDWEKLVLKLENFLKINISKKPVVVTEDTKYREIDPTKIKIERDFREKANFDEITTRHLTISDLKRMREDKLNAEPVSKSVSDEEEFLDPFIDEDEKPKRKWWKKDKSINMSERDLTPEEVERIIKGE